MKQISSLPKLGTVLNFDNKYLTYDKDNTITYDVNGKSYYTNNKMINLFYKVLGLYNKSFFNKLSALDNEVAKSILSDKIKNYAGSYRVLLNDNNQYLVMDNEQVKSYSKFELNQFTLYTDEYSDEFLSGSYYLISLNSINGLILKIDIIHNQVEIYSYYKDSDDNLIVGDEGSLPLSDSYDSLKFYNETTDFSYHDTYASKFLSSNVSWFDYQSSLGIHQLSDEDKETLSYMGTHDKIIKNSPYELRDVLSLVNPFHSDTKLKEYLKVYHYLKERYLV